LIAQKECSSAQYEEQLLSKYPSSRQDISAANAFLNNWRSDIVTSGAGSPVDNLPVITIPVVIHILYKESSHNISDEQVYSQIETLNKAFMFQHADTGRIPSYFRNLAANCRIQFCLAKKDPKGYVTSGIIRKSTGITMFNLDDRIKYSSQGGDDAWPSDKYLNIWVGNLAGGLIGYSSALGGPADRDGIAIRPNAFGTHGSAAAPFEFGKTAVHEVGHWLGLRHIWGDASCGNDYVDDTPTQRSSNNGCPSGIKVSCSNGPYGDMYMNYMDLTNDKCMVMFTIGQMNRMRSAFAPGGPRAALLNSQACNDNGLPQPIVVPESEKPVVKLVNAYPNPAQSILYIDIKDNVELLGAEITIVNQFGLAVKTARISQARTSINVANLVHGIYILKVDNGKNKYQEKFLKL
jgi:hypothetical protein